MASLVHHAYVAWIESSPIRNPQPALSIMAPRPIVNTCDGVKFTCKATVSGSTSFEYDHYTPALTVNPSGKGITALSPDPNPGPDHYPNFEL